MELEFADVAHYDSSGRFMHEPKTKLTTIGF